MGVMFVVTAMSCDRPERSLKKVSRRRLIQIVGGSVAAAFLPVRIAPVEAQENFLANYSVPGDLASYAKKVKSFRLPNGATFIVLERGVSPTVSFVTYVDVGGADEEDGKTGIAHFLEHLAFKGTTTIGTKNYEAERPFLEESDRLVQLRTEALKAKRPKREIDAINRDLKDVEEKAEAFVLPNDFAKIVQREGGVGLNAATSIESTQYYYNFPSNKTELWFAMESERFQQPVFRQFEKERHETTDRWERTFPTHSCNRSVVLEERKLRVDNDPTGKFLESLLAKAFEKHPYRRPVIGYEDDIKGLSRSDVRDFFSKYYLPQNITFAIVGDVQYDQIVRLAEKYFGNAENQPDSTRKLVVEPPQTSEKDLTMKLDTQPLYVQAYHVPGLDSPDTPAMEVLEGILSGGRTSRMFRSLVVEKQIALQASFSTEFPGNKYPNLGLVFALPSQGTSLDDLAKAVQEELEKVKQPGSITQSELDRVKRAKKVAYLQSFQSNSAMAGYLCEFAAKTGDPANAFRALNALEAVTPDDVTRVAQQIFRRENCTIGKIV